MKVADDPTPFLPDIDHDEAFQYEPMWEGKLLEGFTMSRQSLAAQLSSQLPGIGSQATDEAYMPDVWAVLWLCNHKPEQWRHLRADHGRWWEVIEAWAETHCPRDKWDEAIALVYGRKATDTMPAVLGLWPAARANVVTLKQPPSLTGGNG